MNTRFISVSELKERIGEALANWDFDACSHYGAEQKEALERAYENPEMLCDNGECEVPEKESAIWDFLSEYAESTGANIAFARNNHNPLPKAEE